MSASGNKTLTRIQQEIEEARQRDIEYHQKLSNNASNGHVTNGNISREAPVSNGVPPVAKTRYIRPTLMVKQPSQGRGVMEKFLKTRGKLSILTIASRKTDALQYHEPHSPQLFQPVRVSPLNGKPGRNGFVSAEEKMKKELQDFEKREAELRNQRRQNQPQLMASLEENGENNNTNLTQARSLVSFYSQEDLTDLNPVRLNRTKSLAQLCDASDEELEAPGTFTLINHFEKLRAGN